MRENAVASWTGLNKKGTGLCDGSLFSRISLGEKYTLSIIMEELRFL
jgi:hypothetical protein